MLKKHGILHPLFRRDLWRPALATAALLLVGNGAWGDDARKVKTEPAVRLLTTIPVPPTAAAVSTVSQNACTDTRGAGAMWSSAGGEVMSGCSVVWRA